MPLVCDCCGCFKSIGVKLKLFVKEKDRGMFEGGDDDVDDLIQLLQLTPDLNNDTANWTTVVVYGVRSRHKTR